MKSAWTDVRRALTLQTDRQIKELSADDNECALLVHVKGVTLVLQVNFTNNFRPARKTCTAHIMVSLNRKSI